MFLRMGRKLRVGYTGANYHVMNRGDYPRAYKRASPDE